MKKISSLLLVVALLITMLTPMNIVSAAQADQSNPSHLIMDFENGAVGNTDSDTDYTAAIVDGAGVSSHALKVTTSGTGAPSFTFGYRPGYTYSRSCKYDANGNPIDTSVYETVTVERKYEFSAWIKVDSAPSSDTVVLKHEIAHPSYNSSWYKFTPATLEKTFLTIDSAGLKAGEWVKVSGEFVTDQNDKSIDATYKYYTNNFYASLGINQQTRTATYTLPEAMPVKVVVGGGMSYTIDDFVIMTKGSVYSYSNTPDSDTSVTREDDRYYKPQHQTYGGVGNGLGLYSFQGLSEITTTANSDGWRVAQGTATLTAANGETIDGVPNETLRNNYVTITSTANDGQIVCEDIDYRFGTSYSVYVWARAENETALKARLQAVINLKYRTDTENIKTNFLTAYSNSILPVEENQSIYLTNEWRRYYFAFKSTGVTYDQEFADFSLKITNNGQTDAEGNSLSLAGAKYSLGNIKFYQQTGTDSSVLDATGSMSAYPAGTNSYNVGLDSYVTSGNITNCITRFMVPFNGDYVITKVFTNWKNEETFRITTDDISSIKMVVNPRDRSNHYGGEYTAFATTLAGYGLTAVADFDQTVWAYDMPNLTATIRYNAPSGGETLKALCGMYDADNKMVASDIREFTLSAGEGTASLSMDTVKEAVTAKVFLWEADTHAPRKDNVPVLSKTTKGTFIYVDAEKGSPMINGYGYNAPVKTLSVAVEELAGIRAFADSDVYIILMPGNHYVDSQLAFDGANTSANTKTVITSYNKNDKGVISGGMDLTGKFTPYENGIYRAPVPVGTQSRQLYVDGVKGVRARSEGRLNGFTNTNVYNDAGSLVSGGLGAIVATDTSYKNFEHIDDLEFIFYSLWTMGRCGVSSISENDDGTITFNMDAPGFKNLSSKGNTRSRTPAWIENAYELIDVGGEWYLDEEGGYLYYLPRDGENMAKAEVILPVYDNYFMEDGPMIKAEGTAGAPARNVEFNGVGIAHTTWTRPSTVYGHSDAQNNHLRESTATDAPTGDRLADSAVLVTYADNIDFLNCDITRLGITAIKLLDGSDNCDITGNEFFYISGGAVNIGDPYQGVFKADGTGLKTDEVYILDNINVTNNYIHHVAHDYWSAAAISAGHPRNSTIMHNEICNIPYSGMHIGYGWSSYPASTMLLKIENNYIHDLFQGDIYDGGGIYTIGGTGGTQENPCTLRGNFIENIGPGGATLYNDQGSRFWLVENNVSDISDAWGEYDPTTGAYKGSSNCMNINHDSTDATRDNYTIWRNNYTSVNDVYIGGYAEYNDTTVSLERPIGLDVATGMWSAEARAIIENAGIEEEYRQNFEFGLQALLVPSSVTLSAGEVFDNAPCLITGKDTMYKSNGLVVEAVSSNTSVATVTADKITAVSAGTATITYTVKEGYFFRTAKIIVTVK